MQHQISCPKCHSKNNSIQTSYSTKNNGSRKLLKCNDCEQCYSETSNTFMFNIKFIKIKSLEHHIIKFHIA